MKYSINKHSSFAIILVLLFACNDDFLDRAPLDTPSLDTFWENEEQAELWVNNLYLGLGGADESLFEAFSDNAYGRAGSGANNIANGLYDTNDPHVKSFWNYRYIRLALEFFDYVKEVPNISAEKESELSGQVHFMLAYEYSKLVNFYGSVPLVTTPLSIEESDIPKSSKEEVLAYIFSQLDLAIEKLPLEWPESETGRITKGAALALKARMHLYNSQWSEAANTAKQIMDLNQYSLHPNFREVFLTAFNNQTEEVILAHQYAANVNTHPGQGIVRKYAPVNLGGYALVLPTDELQQSFEMSDGSPFDWNNPEHAARPFDNRDPRFYETFIYQGIDYNGATVDFTGSEARFAFTYIYYLKYVADLENKFWDAYVNWILFRYADVLLMYAEAKNEVSGPDQSIYDALNLIRNRAGMPDVDQTIYNDQSSLREFIRNERRVELAGEGLRYFDILRWGIAEDVLNKEIKSMDLSNWVDLPRDENGNSLLPYKDVQTRIFDPAKHYTWPIPQDAIDRAKNLEQNPNWK